MAQQKSPLPPPPHRPVRPPSQRLPEVSPIRLAHFLWPHEELGMKQVVSAAILHAKANVESDLMFLCRVTEGYQGCDLWHEFSSDELYWVRGIARQQRLVVMDAKGRYLSIPYNYYRKFNASYDGFNFENTPQTLTQLRHDVVYGGLMTLQVENDEPVLVNIGSQGPSGYNEKLGALKVVDCYDEKYLVAHSIASGNIYCDATIIPVYMPITVTTAKGFDPKENVIDDFDQWMSDVRKIVAGLPYKEPQMCQEIVLFNEKPNNEYEYTMPAAFVVEMQRQSSTRHKDEYQQRYVNILSSMKKTDTNASKCQLPEVRVRKTSRPLPPLVPGNEYEMIEDARNPIALQKCTDVYKTKDTADPRTETGSRKDSISNNVQSRRLPPPPKSSNDYETIDIADQTKETGSRKDSTNSNGQPCPLLPPRKSRHDCETIDIADKTKKTGSRTDSIKNNGLSRRLPPPPTSRDDYEIIDISDQTKETGSHTHSSSNNGRSPPPPIAKKNIKKVEKLDDTNHVRQCGTSTDGGGNSGSSNEQDPKCSQMSIPELIDYLNRMKLGQYSNAIKSRGIDGRQLTTMSTTQLISELGFTENHATVLQFLIQQDVCCR